MTQEHIFLFSFVGAVAMGGFALMLVLVGRDNPRLRSRLRETAPQPAGMARRTSPAISSVLHRIGKTAGRPFEPKNREERSNLRSKLNHAGIYSPAAVQLMAGLKVLALTAGVAGGYAAGLAVENIWIGVGLGGVIGYMIPDLWLTSRIYRHQRAIDNALPDALDLMVVCVEAGLTVDAAMQRVGQEISLAHPILARELAITHLETQMAVPHAEALRNFARRTGSASVKSLAAMLIQAERFGTGLAAALRVHAESMRVKRQYAAEERAAKASLKITFPLVLCIFPSLMVVLAGPAFIRLIEQGFINR